MSDIQPGWYPMKGRLGYMRYWKDGWTDHVMAIPDENEPGTPAGSRAVVSEPSAVAMPVERETADEPVVTEPREPRRPVEASPEAVVATGDDADSFLFGGDSREEATAERVSDDAAGVHIKPKLNRPVRTKPSGARILKTVDPRALSRNSLLGFGFILLAVLWIVVSFAVITPMVGGSPRVMKDEVVATGTVTQLLPERDANETTPCAPVVVFSVEDVDHTVSASEYTSPCEVEVGQKMKVAYMEVNVDNTSRILQGGEPSSISGLVYLFAAPFLGAAIFFLAKSSKLGRRYGHS